MELSSKFSTYDEIRTFSPSLAYEIGINKAIFVKQLEYWIGNIRSGKIADGRKWVRDTANEWHKQLPYMTTRTIENIIKSLIDKDILLVRKDLNRKGYDQTRWYSINFNKINDIFDKSRLTINFDNEKFSYPNMKKFHNALCKNFIMENEKISYTIPKHSSKYSSKHSPKHYKSSSNEHDTAIHDEACKVIDYLNKHASKRFRHSKSSLKFVNARLKDGYSSKDFKHVIDLKIYEWKNNIKMNKFLRPATLFNATKFESYLNENMPSQQSNNINYSSDNADGGVKFENGEIKF